ncbi:MAG TPA: tRNA uridine-5-carboxymethylaminomethyl(34) synthesis GTPase MnmE [Opitutales bacterium]|jgi:tRNA modification GTPase|nr:tRNA uridine-5-carboxymethylaminomethyl(34) synthesis GTPase MnmE [Opitutales bacterium]
MPLGDTIAAAATPAGESALAILRASGPLVPALAAAVLNLSPDKIPAPRHATFGHYHTLAGESLDHIVLTRYAAPHSATGDDLLEISCHGNPLIVQRILNDLLARGCRPAQPGEFTRAAFLNGKIDLTQAEAVADLIRARSDGALRAARRQLDGQLSRRIQDFTAALLQIQAEVEARLDFPEEDLPAEDTAQLRTQITALAADIAKLLATTRYGNLLRDGAHIVIAGPPNAGKSSLLNALLGRPRAIVSPTPGTTRDYLEETFHSGPYSLQITDTAGIPSVFSVSSVVQESPPQDLIELEGIKRSFDKIATADFLLLVIDSTQPPPSLPQSLLSSLHPSNTLIIENKTDLSGSISQLSFLPDYKHLRISIKTGDGLESLRSQLTTAIESAYAIPHDDLILITTRHADTLNRTHAALLAAVAKLADQSPLELPASHLRDALDSLGEILGRIDNEAMLDRLFATFCIGK